MSFLTTNTKTVLPLGVSQHNYIAGARVELGIPAACMEMVYLHTTSAFLPTELRALAADLIELADLRSK